MSYRTSYRTDPFREFDRFAQQFLAAPRTRSAVPMDAYRDGEQFVVKFDLPSVDPATIDLTVDRKVLTVSAERPQSTVEGAQVIVSERPTGTFRRRLFLGDSVDSERIEAGYADGVLTLTLPVAEQAKPRKVSVTRTAEVAAEPADQPAEATGAAQAA